MEGFTEFLLFSLRFVLICLSVIRRYNAGPQRTEKLLIEASCWMASSVTCGESSQSCHDL